MDFVESLYLSPDALENLLAALFELGETLGLLLALPREEFTVLLDALADFVGINGYLVESFIDFLISKFGFSSVFCLNFLKTRWFSSNFC